MLCTVHRRWQPLYMWHRPLHIMITHLVCVELFHLLHDIGH